MLVSATQKDVLPAGMPRKRLDFKYDAGGRRYEKVVKDSWNGTSGTTVTHLLYLYDGWNLLAEIDVLDSDSVERSYTWGLDKTGSLQGAGGVGGLLFLENDEGTYHPAYDGNGNVVGLIDASSGETAATYQYGPFGEPLGAEGEPIAEANPIRFSTKYWDAESDLIYYGYRYYNPSTGRFLSRDLIGETGGLNLYGFVGNDPVNNWDYLGMFVIIEIPPPIDPTNDYVLTVGTIRLGDFEEFLHDGSDYGYFDYGPDGCFWFQVDCGVGDEELFPTTSEYKPQEEEGDGATGPRITLATYHIIADQETGQQQGFSIDSPEYRRFYEQVVRREQTRRERFSASGLSGVIDGFERDRDWRNLAYISAPIATIGTLKAGALLVRAISGFVDGMAPVAEKVTEFGFHAGSNVPGNLYGFVTIEYGAAGIGQLASTGLSSGTKAWIRYYGAANITFGAAGFVDGLVYQNYPAGPPEGPPGTLLWIYGAGSSFGDGIKGKP